MRVFPLLLLLATFSAFTTGLHGQQLVSPQDKIHASIEIIMQDDSGFDAPFRSPEPDPLAFVAEEAGVAAVDAASEAALPQSATTQADGVWDGIVVGAAIGAGAGALIGYNRRTFECKAGCSVAIGTVIGAPAGALVGYFVDSGRE